jgi:hypothetical protein
MLSLEWAHDGKKPLCLGAEAHLILKSCTWRLLLDTVQVRTKAKRAHHREHLASEDWDNGAENNHGVSAVEVDGAIRFNESAEAGYRGLWLCKNPRGNAYALSMLAPSLSLPSEEWL